MLIKLSLTQCYFSQVAHFSNNPSTLAGQIPVVQSPRVEQNHKQCCACWTWATRTARQDLQDLNSPGRIASKGQGAILLSLEITFHYASQDHGSFKKPKAIALFRCWFWVRMLWLSAMSLLTSPWIKKTLHGLKQVWTLNCEQVTPTAKAGSSEELSPQSTYLYLVAWVATVTEKPRIPEVFLQVGYTW